MPLHVSQRAPIEREPIFYLGLDLGQVKDYTALTVIECIETPSAPPSQEEVAAAEDARQRQAARDAANETARVTDRRQGYLRTMSGKLIPRQAAPGRLERALAGLDDEDVSQTLAPPTSPIQGNATLAKALAATPEGDRYPRYHVRWLERLRGMPYPQVVAKVLAMMETPQLAGKVRALVVDATGVGRPVVDMFNAAQRRASLVAISITGGDTVSHEPYSQEYRVPKRELASVLQVVLQEGRLVIADALPEATTLVNELLNFKVKINVAGHDTYEAWREADHDDLVLAAALPLWYADRGQPPTPRITSFDEW